MMLEKFIYRDKETIIQEENYLKQIENLTKVINLLDFKKRRKRSTETLENHDFGFR